MKTQTLALGFAAAACLPALGHAAIGTVMRPQTLNQFLAKDYYVQSKFEDQDHLDIKDQYIFIDRSVSALHGDPVWPVSLNGLSYVGETRDTMAANRARLVRVLHNPNIVQAEPAKVARAQVDYDCWAVHQQAGPNASHNLVRCKREFLTLIDQLDTGPAPVAAAPVHWRILKMYNVYFDWDKSTIRPDAATTLDEIKHTLHQAGNEAKRIAIGGYADRSGAEGYNQALSERRVKAVAAYLGVTPLTAKDVDLRAYGEDNPPVPTADGVKLQANRVAKVAIVEVQKEENQ
jgi:outer membrane protein OmpA-like peptidoglycan-associated protein